MEVCIFNAGMIGMWGQAGHWGIGVSVCVSQGVGMGAADHKALPLVIFTPASPMVTSSLTRSLIIFIFDILLNRKVRIRV